MYISKHVCMYVCMYSEWSKHTYLRRMLYSMLTLLEIAAEAWISGGESRGISVTFYEILRGSVLRCVFYGINGILRTVSVFLDAALAAAHTAACHNSLIAGALYQPYCLPCPLLPRTCPLLCSSFLHIVRKAQRKPNILNPNIPRAVCLWLPCCFLYCAAINLVLALKRDLC